MEDDSDLEDGAWSDLIGESALADLAALLRSGEPISEGLRDELAALIDARQIAFVDVPAIARARRKAARVARDLEIGAWVAVRKFMTRRGSYARILAAAADKFRVSQGTAKRCHLDFRRAKERAEAGEEEALSGLMLWHNALRKFCVERGLDYFEIHTALYSVKSFDLDF